MFATDSDVSTEKFGQHRGGHVRVDVSRRQAGVKGSFDLGAQLGSRGFGHHVPCEQVDRSSEIASSSMRPDAQLAVEIGAHRHRSHSLVSVRRTPTSRDGSRAAASAISRNHGPGTITDPQVTSPAAASLRYAALASWLAPRSSTRGITVRPREHWFLCWRGSGCCSSRSVSRTQLT